MEKLRRLLIGISMSIALGACHQYIPNTEIEYSYPNYRTEVIEGNIDISLKMNYGYTDQDGTWINGLWHTLESKGSDLSTIVRTNMGQPIKLQVDGESNTPAKVRISINEQGNPKVEKEITASFNGVTYRVDGEIRYTTPTE